MNHILALLLTLSHGGHWIGGHEGTISLSWPVESGMPASTLQWECRLGPVLLASGNLDMPGAEHPVEVKIIPPVVRTNTDLRFIYSLKSKAGNAELAAGEALIHVHADLLSGDLSKQFSNSRIVLLDRGEELSKVLRKLNVPVVNVTDINHIMLDRPDVLIVGPDQLDASTFGQPMLEGFANRGTSVLVLRQSTMTRITSYRCGDRKAGNSLCWRTDHPLLAGLDSAALGTWVGEAPLRALQLPVDEPALEVAYWKAETTSDVPSPIDALVVTKTIGAGRIVLCQIPADDWQEDPRSQILLRNMLDYALTRPQPTPPPSLRVAVNTPNPSSMRSILVTSGDKP